MSPFARIGAYAAHPDPVTAACNRIALLVASNQPFYPLYLWWIVGGDWPVACWTFLSTPFFLAVPAASRRWPVAGRALLPLTGVGNGIVSAKAFGAASGVELFLIACGLIALLAFPKAWRVGLGTFALVVATAGLHGHYGLPLGRFTPAEYAHFFWLNVYSVTGLCCVILWTLISARRASASR